MTEQLELGPLTTNHALTPRLSRAIQETGNAQLVHFFQAPRVWETDTLAGYEDIVDSPVCIFFESKWKKALEYPPNTLLFQRAPVYWVLNKDVVGGEEWAHDWQHTPTAVLVKNPYTDPLVRGAVGETNALFVHKGIVFAGDWYFGASKVACLRPAQFSFQETLYRRYEEAYKSNPDAFKSPAPLAQAPVQVELSIKV